MNINDLTIGQAKELTSFLGVEKSDKEHPFVGRYVLCRCYSAGVHAGVLVSQEGENVLLKDSRRLWSWEAVQGVALSGAAQHGIKGGRVDVVNPEIYITGVCETIPCSKAAETSIHEYKK